MPHLPDEPKYFKSQLSSKAKAKALEAIKKTVKVKHGKDMVVSKSTTLTNDWKKGKKFHFKSN